MRKYRFSLVKWTLYRVAEKIVFIDALSCGAALNQVEADYSDWQISMFWLCA